MNLDAQVFALRKKSHRNFKKILGIGGLLSFFVAMSLQMIWQYQQDQDTFLQEARILEKDLLLLEQSNDTLLKVLANYYSSQIIKSNEEFARFTNSLVPEHQYIHGFGIAKLVTPQTHDAFIQFMHQQGFESYKIQNRLLFAESSTNYGNEQLAISQILPLDPPHSIYLGEDLFALPTLRQEFFELSQANQMGLYWLRPKHFKEQMVLLSHPVYTNAANDLKPSERRDNVIGSVFLFFDIKPFLTQKALQSIRHLDAIHLQINTHPLKHYWDIYRDDSQPSINNASPANGFPFVNQSLKFHTSLNISGIRQSVNLIIQARWVPTSTHVSAALLAGFAGLILFLLVANIVRKLSSYTKALIQTQSRLSEILTTSHDAVIITEEDGTIRNWNPRAVKLFDYPPEDVIGTPILELFRSLSENNLQDPVEQNLVALFNAPRNVKKTNETLLELYLLNRKGQRLLVEISYSILSVNDSIEISLFIQDITHQRKNESEIKKLAYFDPLTNLENRVLFKQNFENILKSPTSQRFCVYFIDLDGFKEINDTLGHNIGDELLKVIAKRITNTVQGTHQPHHICRFGGDEFIILICNINDGLNQVLLERLLQKIQREIRIDGNEMRVSASIGVTFYPEHGSDMDTLLRHSDTAMYEAKALGKNTFSIYQNEMTEHLSRRLLLEKHLRLALEYNEFSLVYQPQINLTTGDIIGVEALIRWHNQSLGFISPDQFIPIAEESRLIIEIGDWVVDTCIAQLLAWQNTQMDGLHIAINVSSVQFTHPGFVDSVYQKMRTAGLEPHLLEIELTERTVMDNADENVERFNDIRTQGFGLSVDDFGTGYSSLSYLKRFPLTILKIDKSFVDGLPHDDDDISIATAILNLAHNLNIKVVAEGVETIEQLLFLKEADCNFAQGYFISRPLSAEDFELWLAAKTRCFYQSEVFHDALKEAISAEQFASFTPRLVETVANE